MVRATTRPPVSAARSAAASWRGTRSGSRRVDGEHVPVDRRRPAAADIAASSSISSSLKRSRQPSTMPSRVVPSCSPTASHRASSSSRPAQRDATGWPSPSLWVELRVVEKPRPPASIEAWSRATIAVELVGRGLVADGVGAHHVAAEGAVADEEAGVDADAAVEPVEVLAEGLPAPVDALLERGEGHALDLGHHAPEVVGVLGVQRGQGEAAVAADDRGDAVDVRRRGQRVPEELGVVVGVGVDEAGAHDEAGGVERLPSRLLDPAGCGDRHDAPVADADVARCGRERRCRRRRWRRG